MRLNTTVIPRLLIGLLPRRACCHAAQKIKKKGVELVYVIGFTYQKRFAERRVGSDVAFDNSRVSAAGA